MGCDIHLHIEIKVKNKWLHWSKPKVPRNYDVFAKMAGVRNYENEIEPISKPKGLPKNVSQIVKFHSDYWGVDGHSHSWLSLDEIKLLCQWMQLRNYCEIGIEHGYFDYLFGGSIDGLKTYPDSYPKEIEDVRFVFWFDN